MKTMSVNDFLICILTMRPLSLSGTKRPKWPAWRWLDSHLITLFILHLYLPLLFVLVLIQVPKKEGSKLRAETKFTWVYLFITFFFSITWNCDLDWEFDKYCKPRFEFLNCLERFVFFKTISQKILLRLDIFKLNFLVQLWGIVLMLCSPENKTYL